MVGASLHDVRALLAKLAVTGVPVLLCGPTGCGKGAAAKWLHDRSRPGKPFVPLNCGALTEALFESELFGHERGAFTGAFAPAPGLFAAARDGSIFLDEIGEMPLALQVKLLQVIDERKARRVGAVEQYDVRARIIAATNVDLDAAVETRRFRPDLSHRLVVRVEIPTLDARLGDIPEIVDALARDIEPPLVLAAGALEWLMTERWPGNVRELRNVLQRAAIESAGAPVGPRTLHEARRPRSGTKRYERLADARGKFERDYTRSVLKANGDNVSATARMLGVGRTTVIKHRDKK